MEELFFSIMVPVYNVENYLHQCIDSVLQQDYTNYELILVDDGSSDDSGKICDEYANKDIRIRVFHKSNEGLLLTRRFGIKQAKYDWMVFLDSDDYWNPGLLQMLASSIQLNSVDMVLFNYCTVNDEGVVLRKHKGVFPDGEILSGNDRRILFEIANGKRLNSIWIKVVNRRIVDIDRDYSEYRDKKGEDILQSITLFNNSSRILYRDCTMYNYRLSVSGRGRNFKPKYIYDAEVVSQEVANYIRNKCGEGSSILTLFLQRYLEKVTKEIVKSAGYYSSLKECESILKDISEFALVNECQMKKIYKKLKLSDRIVYQCFKKGIVRPIQLYYKIGKDIEVVKSKIR